MKTMNIDEVERVVLEGLRAMDKHGDETGHDVSSFVTPKDKMNFTCTTCGTIVYEGPEIIE